jgi:hypothetical protein
LGFVAADYVDQHAVALEAMGNLVGARPGRREAQLVEHSHHFRESRWLDSRIHHDVQVLAHTGREAARLQRVEQHHLAPDQGPFVGHAVRDVEEAGPQPVMTAAEGR